MTLSRGRSKGFVGLKVSVATALLVTACAQAQAQPRQTQATIAAQQQAQQQGQMRPAPMPEPMPPRDLVTDALDQTAPLNAAEVKKLLTELANRNRAGMENHSGQPQPRPVTSSEKLDLSPGATPPVLRVAAGQGVVVSFVDAAGRPWEIADDLNFNANSYSVRTVGKHLYTIRLKQPAVANITMVLKDLPRPIVLTVIPAQDEVDYLKEYTVPKFLDGAPPASVVANMASGGPGLNSEELLNFLYATAPKDALRLTVTGMPGVMAWQNSPTTMVVRTSGLLVIPAWKRRHASNETAVFEVPISPLVTIVQDGVQNRVRIDGFSVSSRVTARQ